MVYLYMGIFAERAELPVVGRGEPPCTLTARYNGYSPIRRNLSFPVISRRG